MRRRFLAALVVMASATAMLLTATPASAATYDVRTAFNPGTAHDGAARMDGVIDFIGPGGADVSAWVEDICPADGYGAYGRLRIVTMTGSVRFTGWLWSQTQGCNRSVYYGPRLVTADALINYLQVQVCERDHNGGNWRTGDCKYSVRKDNPHT